MATIKKAQTGAKVKKPVAKPKEDKYKGLGGEIGRPIFSDKEQRERRKKLGLPTSKAEEKAYYEKMAREGAKNGRTIKKAKSGLGMKSVKSGYDNNSGVTRADFVAIGKGTAKSGAKMKNGGTKKAALGALLPLAMKAAPMVAGMFGGGGKGKSGGMGGMLGGLMGKNGKTVKKAKSGGSMKKCKYGCK
jgi:hypothetical protein